MTISLANNYYNNIQTRSPMARFGKYHIYNSYLCVYPIFTVTHATADGGDGWLHTATI